VPLRGDADGRDQVIELGVGDWKMGEVSSDDALIERPSPFLQTDVERSARELWVQLILPHRP
jgi:hypothetical protein